MVRRFLPYVGVIVAAVLLAVFEQDLLYRLQEQNLFLHTPLFFEQRMLCAGGLLTWVGAYLTQFFYYPPLGAGILCLLWIVLMWLLKRTFRLEGYWLTLVPVACLLLTITDLGYWVYYLKLPGHAFDAAVGTIVAVVLALTYRQIPRKRYLSALFVVLAGFLGYPLVGFYGLLAVVLMGILSWLGDCHRLADCLVATLTAIIVPLLCYHVIYHETNIVNIYWTALPVFGMRGETYFAYNLPYIVLVASIGLMALPFARNRWLQVVMVAAAVVCVAVFWYKDDNFRSELSMTRSCEQQDWEKVLETAKDVKGEPTRAICMMKNLALFRLRRQGDEMFRYPEGAKRPDAPFPILMVHTIGKRLYLEYGVLNYCYRWCMEDGVEYGWSVEKLKLMALCSLVNGETEAARRYLNMLKKTDFHKSWAKLYETFIRRPQEMKYDAELMAIHDMMRQDNFLTADMGQLEHFLLEHFSTAQSNVPLLQEQILFAAMQTKDMKLFWQQFYQYTELHKNNDKIPVHFQEAACLFGHLNYIDVSNMPFDRQVVKDYQGFAGTVGEYQRKGMTINQIRPLVYDRYHHTYYYDFYFNRYNYVEK